MSRIEKPHIGLVEKFKKFFGENLLKKSQKSGFVLVHLVYTLYYIDFGYFVNFEGVFDNSFFN
jgi:hypothetical protein